ncbi:MAG TPA: C4-type zinc ribbon domain-containing protein, partial [Exilispira sp.]|nr:C4-type zinc ribbon domain-containing protein [Exilispira sp.]
MHKKQEELEKLLNKKKEILENIDIDIIEKFDRIFQNKGDLAIVPVYKNYCSGCNMILPFSLINKVKAQKEIVFCPYCSRMLYFSEEEII